MPATITYDDGSGQTQTNPRVFTITDAMLGILERFRQSITTQDPSTKAMVPTYPTIPDLFRGFLNQSTMAPAIQAFPPDAVVAARQAVAAAQQDLQSVVAQTITGVLQD